MAKNNLDQAPKIRSTGEKNPAFLGQNRVAWGKAVRPHELETIFNNCIDAKSAVQYRLMLFLTGNAEEKFDVSLKNVMTRCNISKDAYYKNRAKLEEKGWISVEEEGDKSYITIHYDKIYQDGGKYIGLKESNCAPSADESEFENYIVQKESKIKTSTDNEGNCKNTTVQIGGNCEAYSDESNLQNTTDEGNLQTYTQKESNSQTTTESNLQNTYEGKRVNSQYNINNSINNNIRTKTEEELKAEFDAQWKNGGNCETTTVLTGAAAMF